MSTATDTLAAYQAAELAVLKGQTFRLGDKQVTFADLAMIQAGRREWERRVNTELAAAASLPGQAQSLGFSVASFNDGYCRGDRW